MSLRACTLLVLSGLFACSATAAEDADEGAAAVSGAQGLGAAATSKWDAYVARVTAESPLQPSCVPTRISPPSGTAHRGVVVIFHGYTACPQQFFEIGKQMAAGGFEVLLPLLPGEGRPASMVNGKAVDDVAALPGTSDWGRYRDLGKEMDAIVAAAPGEHVVSGLSVGGAVATSALLDAPQVYDRALFMTAFYDAAPLITRLLVPVADWLVPGYRTGWGAGCEAERAGGRGGICQFDIDHLEASRRFGRDTLARTKGASVRAKIQFAGVESDPAALNDDEQKAKANLPNAKLCFFEKGTNHSFLSPFDGPHDDKFWLAAAKKQVAEFVTDGTAFTTVGASIERGADRCLTRL